MPTHFSRTTATREKSHNHNSALNQNHEETNTKERTITINKHIPARPQHNETTARNNETITNHCDRSRTTNHNTENSTMTTHHTHTKNVNHNIENTGRTDHHSITETAPDTIVTQAQAQPTTGSVFATLHPDLQKGIARIGFTTPTPIQQKTIPAGIA
ncbi:MAG TPA: hypothetical protein PKI71_11460, partial [Candidatus Rifleibacterium sp.]|nr:hypothetical protein [Candidatus Rifleibacterium sp.]